MQEIRVNSAGEERRTRYTHFLLLRVKINLLAILDMMQNDDIFLEPNCKNLYFL